MWKTIYWICWHMWSWKTFLCEQLESIAKLYNQKIKIINVDQIRRLILSHSQNKKYINLRKKLAQKLNLQTNLPTHQIDWKVLWNKIFFNPKDMEIYKSTINPHITNIIKNKIKKYNWIVLLEWAALVEDWLLPICSYNVILTKCSKAAQIQRFEKSDLPLEQLRKRLQHFLPNIKTINIIKNMINAAWRWNLIIFDTSNNPSKSEYFKLFNKIK